MCVVYGTCFLLSLFCKQKYYVLVDTAYLEMKFSLQIKYFRVNLCSFFPLWLELLHYINDVFLKSMWNKMSLIQIIRSGCYFKYNVPSRSLHSCRRKLAVCIFLEHQQTAKNLTKILVITLCVLPSPLLPQSDLDLDQLSSIKKQNKTQYLFRQFHSYFQKA